MRRALLVLCAACALAAAVPASAAAAFGFQSLDARFLDPAGGDQREAGSHPFSFVTELEMNTVPAGEGKVLPDGQLRDIEIAAPVGLAAAPSALPSCSTANFIEVVAATGFCPAATAVGVAEVNAPFAASVLSPDYEWIQPIYNLPPPPGSLARFGFSVENLPVIIDVGVSAEPPYRGLAKLTNTANLAQFMGSRVRIWGHPSDPAHDDERGKCARPEGESCPFAGEVEVPELDRAFLIAPRSCTGAQPVGFAASAWNSGATDSGEASAPAMSECARLGLSLDIDAQPTNRSAAGPSGLRFELDIEDEGLLDPGGIAGSDIKEALVTLPEGVTANPSLAEGLVACSQADLAREALDSAFGEGCPQASKIGDAQVQTPILPGEVLDAQIYIAAQGDNPFGSLLAFYLVVKDPELGILVKQAAEIEPDPATGRLVTRIADLPQFPLGRVEVNLRSGGRSPLITPSRCGTYTTEATFVPWADPGRPLSLSADFQISAGVGGAGCPQGPAPFEPGFQAASENPQGAAHSPFNLRLTRRDGDQDLTRFEATLPPGLTARLTGAEKCSEAQIAAARAKSGREEQAAPSCPPGSRIGSILAGAGVGAELTYVPGSLYLAGPTGGAPLSVLGIVPAVAGPFDVGNVVVRQALRVDPRSARVRVDPSASDPIPHILAGIPLRVRDIRVAADRPQFTLNPTNCRPLATEATLWGGGEDPFGAADDSPVARSAPFQAANCAALGFRPRLAMTLRGGTRRGANPALRAVLRPRPGDANFRRAVVTLPRSAFLDQAHIRTICTRVQFAASACPKGSIYGYARAFTPILDAPAQGPVYLRSSDNELPDLVMALKGPPSAPVDVEVPARIDSNKGGIRATFAATPDLPVSRLVLNMQGGKKGLIVNSRNLCAKKSRAVARFAAQNGRFSRTKPRMVATKCQKRRKAKRNAKRARASRAPIADQAGSRR